MRPADISPLTSPVIALISNRRWPRISPSPALTTTRSTRRPISRAVGRTGELIREHIVERIFEQGDEAFALYRCKTTDGKEFHNSEFFTFKGDRLKGVQVFFGAAYRNGKFIQQQQS
jgi:hypothetical protein